MKQRRLWAVGRAAIVALLLGALIVNPVLAAAAQDEEAEEIEFTGTVVSVSTGEAGCTLVVSVETDGVVTEYTVEAPAGFDCTTVAQGDTVEVEGTLGEGGVVVASKVALESEDDDSCSAVGFVHPVGMRLAAMYGASYEQVMTWFCGGAGFGQIKHALQTAQRTAVIDPLTGLPPDITVAADGFLSQRKAGQGWGQIWQGVSLVGKGKKAGDASLTEQTEGDGSGEPKGHGRPAWAGQGRGKKH